jgi:hypothetical protein
MGIPVSLLLIGVGAILAFAVEDRSSAVNLDAVGIILMIVGGIGLLLSLLWWDRLGFGYWRRAEYPGGTGPRYGYGRRARRTVVEEDAPPPPAPPDY